MKKEEKIKVLNNYIEELNTKNEWRFYAKEITKMFDERFGIVDTTEFIHNCLKYLVKENKLEKIATNNGYYFGFVKERYHSPIEELSNVNLNSFNVSNKVSKLFEDLDQLTYEQSKEYFAEESLFSTIVEYSTLNEHNIKTRSKNIEDLEVIEKNNIENLYKTFVENEIKTYIDETFIKNIHSRIFLGIMNTHRMGGKSGEFADIQNYISGGYIPCDISNKLSELKEFIKFYNTKPASLNDAIVRVAIASYWFAGIHIFSDGNSRTGRFLISYYMYLHGYSKNLNFTISKSLNRIGGKEIFVLNQAKSWEQKSISNYVNWFINDLINDTWVMQQTQKLKLYLIKGVK